MRAINGDIGKWPKKKPGRKRKKIHIPTEKEQKLINHYVETGNMKEAKEVAGYPKTYNPLSKKSIRYELERLQDKVKSKLVNVADTVADNMVDLAFNARSENVKFQASKDILDRAGLAPVNKTENETHKYISVNDRFARGALERFLQEKTIDITPQNNEDAD